MSSSVSSVKVDIWSDIACPWCYIGKRRFEAGVAAFARDEPDVAIEVESHSFELAPDTPIDFAGSEVDFLVRHKGMPAEQVEQMLSQMTALGSEDGVVFNFDLVQHTNTARAHRILHLAKERGVQSQLLDRLYRAYFTEGENLADPEVLARLGTEVGLEAQSVRDALDDDRYGEAVDRDITRVRMLGANGVPFFLLDQKYAVSGAQSAETFAAVLAQVAGLARGVESIHEEA